MADVAGDPDVQKWDDWLKAGCPAKGTTGREFMRYLEANPEKHKLYFESGKGRSEKTELRKDMAKMKLENVKVSKGYMKTYKKVDVSKGKYMLPKQILIDQGGAT